jgi:PBP1b-binding outer membrane lipoprotein LpoB
MPRQSRLWYGLAALVLAGCSSWQVQDRQNFVENCAQSLHRLRKDSYTDLPKKRRKALPLRAGM